MDLSELKAAVARDRKRVEDMDRIAGLLDAFADSAGVPLAVDAGAERIVVTVDVSGLQAPRLYDERYAEIEFDVLDCEDPCGLRATATADVGSQPAADAPAPPADAHVAPDAPALVTGPLGDHERTIVQDMLDAGATGKEIGARLNRDPRQLGGVIAAMRRGPRKRVLTPPAAKPAPVAHTPPPASEPVAEVPYDMSAAARQARLWDDQVARVPETALFDRALDIDLMTSLSEGLSAKDFASTRELTPTEVAGRFLLLMGEAPRTLANQGLCIAALRRAIVSKSAA